MSSSAQTENTHDGESSKFHATSPPSPPPPPPPLQSFNVGCPASDDETGEQTLRPSEKGKKEGAKNISLSPKTAPKPPPISPPSFKTEQQTHAFPSRPEPVQTNGPAKKRRHYPRPSRKDLDRLDQNYDFATSDIEIDCAEHRYGNCFHSSELHLGRLRSKKRGKVERSAAIAFSNLAYSQAKNLEGEDDGFGDSVDFSDVEAVPGESYEDFADDNVERRILREGGDRRLMPPPERRELYEAFPSGFDAVYFNDNNGGHAEGVLGTEPMSSLFNASDDDERDRPRMRNVPGMAEAGIAQSREIEFGNSWFEDRDKLLRSERNIPGGLIELARRRNECGEEEGISVGATKYMIDEVHHRNMVRALKGKPSLAVNVEAQSVSVNETGSVERNHTESAEAWKQQRSERRRVSRIPVAVRPRPAI